MCGMSMIMYDYVQLVNAEKDKQLGGNASQFTTLVEHLFLPTTWLRGLQQCAAYVTKW